MNQSSLAIKSQHPAANDSSAFIDKIRPDSGIAEPIYKQLLRRIVQLIESGEIGEGFSLPSERALAESLDLSRTTVRRCYEELRAQDHIDTHGRAGVTVKAPPKRIAPEMGRLKGFTEEMRELGIVPSTRILEHNIVVDRTIASIFNRPASNRFLKIVRLRLGDGNPMSREVAWPIVAVDATGAGDAFNAGLIWALERETTEQALRIANACGAYIAERNGVLAHLPEPHELQAFMRKQPPPQGQRLKRAF